MKKTVMKKFNFVMILLIVCIGLNSIAFGDSVKGTKSKKKTEERQNENINISKLIAKYGKKISFDLSWINVVLKLLLI